jgi:hypothetical protein
MSVPTMTQYTSYQYVSNTFFGRSETNFQLTKIVKTKFTVIYKLPRFSEKYVTNSVLTEDVTAALTRLKAADILKYFAKNQR